MCRALLYLGEPVLLDDLLFQPDSALVRQTYMPKMLDMLNLAGFGMRAWDPQSHDPAAAYAYASEAMPVFDRNLKNLATKVKAGCVLAHIRGVTYSTRAEVSKQNVHPFQFEGIPLTLAHNGDLARFPELRPRLAAHVRPEFARQLQVCYGLFQGHALRQLAFRQGSPPRLRRFLVLLIRRFAARSKSCAPSVPRSASTSLHRRTSS